MLNTNIMAYDAGRGAGLGSRKRSFAAYLKELAEWRLRKVLQLSESEMAAKNEAYDAALSAFEFGFEQARFDNKNGTFSELGK